MWLLWLSLTGCFLLDQRIDAPVDASDTSTQIFEVPSGSSAGGIGPALQSAGLIEDPRIWKLYLKTRKAGGCLKAGKFKLSPSMTMPEIMEVLCGAPIPDDVPFTVVEGWRIREIDAALAEAGLIEPGAYAAAAGDPGGLKIPFQIDGLTTLEGFLYPDTYRVEPAGFTAEGFVQRQVDTFYERFVVPNEAAIAERGLYPLVIMASMIEREEPVDSQRSLVAGILWKRLDNKWHLGVDATSRYTLDEWNDRQAFLKMLRDPDDPYNTRLNPGLPPTPIGNPGVTALGASLAPEPSPYWYYLHDKEGVLHPTRNAREHEAMRARYGVY